MFFTKLRYILKKLFIALSYTATAAFLLGCCSAYLPPSIFWFTGILAIALPYLILILIASIFFWLIAKPKYCLIPIITLLLGYFPIKKIIAFNKVQQFTTTKSQQIIRVLNWNVKSFNGTSQNKEIKKNTREDIANLAADLKADVLCMQEFNTSGITNNVDLFKQNFEYVYFPGDYFIKKNNYKSGCVIFSKHPFVKVQQVNFPQRESLLLATINIDEKPVTVAVSHLQSYKFSGDNYAELDAVKTKDAEAIQASKGIVYKMKLAFKRRAQQADIIAQQFDSIQTPIVFCADFNDVANSYSYRKITKSKNFTDAFLAKGYGLGKTFTAIASPLRIDYIFATPNCFIQQFGQIDEDISDHHLLVADIKL